MNFNAREHPQQSSSSVENVKNFVFLDLEATGLQNSEPPPRITEMCLVAVTRTELWNLALKLNKWRNQRLKGQETQQLLEYITPRVLNKLLMCFYPSLRMNSHVCNLTGLDNYNLEDQKRFSAVDGNAIRNFLTHLNSPVCLVAHNGCSYDFPLLKSELNKVDVTLDDLSLSYVDSLIAFRQIFAKEATGASLSEENKNLKIARNHSTASCSSKSLDESDQGEDILEYFTPLESSSDDEETPELKRRKTQKLKKILKEAQEWDPYSESLSDDANEITPDKQPVIGKAPNAPQKSRKWLNKHHRKPEEANSKVRRRLDFHVPISFSLPRLHEHMLGQAPYARHGAEQDCYSLMRICAFKLDDFLNFSDRERKLFSDVAKLW